MQARDFGSRGVTALWVIEGCVFQDQVTTDRAASNLAAERSLRQTAQERDMRPWIHVHSPCDVHKLASCEKSMLQLVESNVSGMVSAGLATRLAGVVGQLRIYLAEILEDKLDVRPGAPTHAEYRQGVYDVFLDNIRSRYSSDKTSSSRANQELLSKKQRAILSTYLNGNLQEETVVHYTMEERSREAVLEDMRRFVIPALLPSCCPLLNRARIMSFESTCAWVGLLCLHHNLFKPLMQRLHGKEVVPAPLGSVTLVEANHSHCNAWFLFANRAAANVTDILGEFLGLLCPLVDMFLFHYTIVFYVYVSLCLCNSVISVILTILFRLGAVGC